MQIRVKCSCVETECREWAIVELQGVVESQPSVGSEIQNLEIGRLCCVSEVPIPLSLSPSLPPRIKASGRRYHPSDFQGSYTFTVGYHELSGTKLPLKKPMLVLRKKKAEAEGEQGSPDSAGVFLEVVGIIRHRILFSTRPKALISSMAARL
ncbi:hypothetical protein AXF42_Ash004618 [Apostasia shenzhenica]|uniref:Uncharacterized protein n=1 Tax=Apostasia shenzhenica TaxID=1088818 RepID=A0A2I0BH55_9ASPA|nr:hypothetical protein AXF42_Ash004618 [Apostasia shenzhenica]